MGNYKNSILDMDASQMLKKFEALVIKEAIKNNIDGRSIAGVITWEYEQNTKGRNSDWWQAPIGVLGDILTIHPRIFGYGLGKGIGWGSVHTKSLEDVKDLVGNKDPDAVRMNAETIIPIIAKIISQNADSFFEKSGGVWINDNPSTLAYFFNTGEDTLSRVSRAKLILTRSSADIKEVFFDVKKELMSKWIYENMNRFENFKTTPKPPTRKYIKSTTEDILDFRLDSNNSCTYASDFYGH